MQTVDQLYQALPYRAATDAEARALVTPPSDEAAHADLLLLCETCTAGEIGTVLAALQADQLDGRWSGTCFAGIVAEMRGRDWGAGVPGVAGAYHDWEEWHIWPGGAPEQRALLGEWLSEALAGP